MKRRALSCSLAAIALFSALVPARSARAQAAHDPVGAEALFRSAYDLLDKGDWAGACPKFAASQELDPAVSTMIKIAQCKEHEGKLAESWYELQEALKLNHEKSDQQEKRRVELEVFAKKQIASVEQRLPHLRITIKNPPPGVSIQRDGERLPAATLGDALPANPGEHTVVVQAPGFVAERHEVKLTEGQTFDLTIELTREPSRDAPPMLAPTVTPARDEAPPGVAPTSNPRRTVGFVVGGVGVAGLLTGSVLAIVDVQNISHPAANESGTPQHATAVAVQDAMIGAFVAGAALTATGAALILTAPKSTSPATALRLSPRALSLETTW